MQDEIKKVMIVGDIIPPDIRDRGILVRSDIKVFEAGSEDEALRIHKTERMNLIIMDLAARGGELSTKIRSDDDLKKVSILMICLDKETDLERSKRCGANAQVTRPLKIEQLNQKVSSLIDIAARQHFRILVRVSIKGKVDDVPFMCSSRDISSGGMSIETEQTLSVGDVIEASFCISNGQMIKADAEVMRSIKKDGAESIYGIKFVKLGFGQKNIIEKFIEKNSKASV